MRAVIFDLWDTLIDYDVEGTRAAEAQYADRLGADPDEFAQRWRAGRHARDTGSLADSFRSVGASDEHLAALVELRHASFLRACVPRTGSVETLHELRRRGLKLGMISVCSEEVAELWEETPFAGLFDSTIFSATCGLRKPDAAIYELCAGQLGVDPSECMFVGDGANDELGGAARVGMQAVLILRPGQDEPYWDEARGWEPRIHSVPEVLELVG
jgi:putative hydrolase of the HAD superfamily